MTTPSFSGQPKWAYDGVWRSGASVKAATELEFADRVQTLWAKYAGTRHAYVFPDPDTAPFFTLTNENTDYSARWISSAGATYTIPWYVQLDHDEVEAQLLLASTAMPGAVECYLYSVTLDDAVASAYGDAVAVHPVSANQLQMAGWQLQNAPLFAAKVKVSVKPTLTATRRIGLRLVANRVISGTPTTDLGPVPVVYVVSMAVRDRISELGG
jgi:hypothetical protein